MIFRDYLKWIYTLSVKVLSFVGHNPSEFKFMYQAQGELFSGFSFSAVFALPLPARRLLSVKSGPTRAGVSYLHRVSEVSYRHLPHP